MLDKLEEIQAASAEWGEAVEDADEAGAPRAAV